MRIQAWSKARAAAVAGSAVLVTTLAIGVVGPTAQAEPNQLPKVHYTNATKVKADGPACAVHWNYPHRGVNDRTWPAGPSTASRIVGVRYTAGGYALVRDGARQRAQTAPWWGWIRKSCLVDPVARKFPRVAHPRDLANRPDPNGYAPALRHRHATGGDNRVKLVDITPDPGRKRGSVKVGTTGTLRNGPVKFAIGNAGKGWVFHITRTTCRRADGRPYDPAQWVFGYSPDARRWGWVQARHLPSCTRA
ncbi:hypothetical protein QQY66_21750 [Streptomyces sp. DG2A-72]|uniref:hypothetical protein n=1 Tax=Streptomyces sp. DG2A-72 TaxID=3051386 RepID=UPI00265BA0D5|nr:hypothetical protein [Streptomyces sp. DG2A-72]MDO0934187.1 hypothetical protein [Streptomyces sp. DG2A-72]